MYFVYTAFTDCPDCDKAKLLLKEKGEDFVAHRVTPETYFGMQTLLPSNQALPLWMDWWSS